MPTATKVERVREIKERLQHSQAALISDYRGITVKDATELRRVLKDAEATFTIVKNTLTKLAAADAGFEELVAILEGPSAITFVQGDVVLAAKRLADAAKRIPSLELKGGVMEGRVLSAEQAQSLATLESREVMLAKLAGLAKAQMSQAAYLFQAVLAHFLRLLDAYKEKVPPGEAPPPASEEAAPANDEASPPSDEAAPVSDEVAPASDEAAPAADDDSSEDRKEERDGDDEEVVE